MRLRKATHPALTLLLVAGLGVCVASAKAQGTVHKKSTASKPGSKAGSSLHRTRSSKKSSRREPGEKGPPPNHLSQIRQRHAQDSWYRGAHNGERGGYNAS